MAWPAPWQDEWGRYPHPAQGAGARPPGRRRVARRSAPGYAQCGELRGITTKSRKVQTEGRRRRSDETAVATEWPLRRRTAAEERALRQGRPLRRPRAVRVRRGGGGGGGPGRGGGGGKGVGAAGGGGWGGFFGRGPRLTGGAGARAAR